MHLGNYYLLKGGELVFRPVPPDLAQKVVRSWAVDSGDRLDFWTVAIEAAALGAESARLSDLVIKWGLTDEDGLEFCKRAGFEPEKDESGLWRVQFQGDPDHVGIGANLYLALVALIEPILKDYKERHHAQETDG